jgi:hypothetical protein
VGSMICGVVWELIMPFMKPSERDLYPGRDDVLMERKGMSLR